MFEKLFDIAKNELISIDENIAGLPEPQVTILFTDHGHYYATANDIAGLICNELEHKKDTKIVNMLTIWKSGQIDLPSIKFRKALVELDVSNCDTSIILQGKDGYLSKRLSETIC